MFEKCETVKLNVSDMHCCHCKAKVEAALKAVKGVKKVRVDLESATAEVSYRASETNPAALAAAVTEAGFPAKDVQCPQPNLAVYSLKGEDLTRS